MGKKRKGAKEQPQTAAEMQLPADVRSRPPVSEEQPVAKPVDVLSATVVIPTATASTLGSTGIWQEAECATAECAIARSNVEAHAQSGITGWSLTCR